MKAGGGDCLGAVKQRGCEAWKPCWYPGFELYVDSWVGGENWAANHNAVIKPEIPSGYEFQILQEALISHGGASAPLSSPVFRTLPVPHFGDPGHSFQQLEGSLISTGYSDSGEC